MMLNPTERLSMKCYIVTIITFGYDRFSWLLLSNLKVKERSIGIIHQKSTQNLIRNDKFSLYWLPNHFSPPPPLQSSGTKEGKWFAGMCFPGGGGVPDEPRPELCQLVSVRWLTGDHLELDHSTRQINETPRKQKWLIVCWLGGINCIFFFARSFPLIVYRAGKVLGSEAINKWN